MRKELPILFSPEMVDAICAGRKWMTRRIINDARVLDYISDGVCTLDYIAGLDFCPYGQEGDLLYVKELHYRFGKWIQEGDTVTGRPAWLFVPVSEEVRFSDNPPDFYNVSRNKVLPEVPIWYKRSSLFMPKSAARIWLQRTDTKIEKVQDITQEDAKVEGVWPKPHRPSGECKPYADYKNVGDCYVCAFKMLWNKIHGPSGNGWDVNHWLYVIGFAVLSITGKPQKI